MKLIFDNTIIKLLGYFLIFSFAVFIFAIILKFILINLSLLLDSIFGYNGVGFDDQVFKVAIGASIGTIFTLFLSFLIKNRTDKKNRLSSLRTALVVIESNILSLILLKTQYAIPKCLETKSDYSKNQYQEILKMSSEEIINFFSSKFKTFNQILNSDYTIDLDSNNLFFFLETESNEMRENLDVMLYHYCRIKECLGYLNSIKNYQGELIKKCAEYLDKDNLNEESMRKLVGKYYILISKSNDDLYNRIEESLVHLTELKAEIINLPGIPESKYPYENRTDLIPSRSVYEKVLGQWHYKRYLSRNNIRE